MTYEAGLVGNLEALVARFSHTLADYLIRTLVELPPGGALRWSQGIDLLTVFMGFGVVQANSQPLLQTGSVDEQDERAHMSRWDLLYALAIFCVLKGIPRREVTPHLKRPLRSFFSRAMADVVVRRAELERLGELSELTADRSFA